MEPEDRHKLAERMNRERVRNGRGKWEQVARAMDMSTALLRKIRNGTAPITYESEVAIEQFYGWPEGEVRRLVAESAAATEAATEARHEWSAEQRAKWKAMTGPEIVAEGRRIRDDLGVDHQIAYLEAAQLARLEQRAAAEATKDSAR